MTKRLPGRAAIAAMPREKQLYWLGRHAKKENPDLNKRWAIPFLAGRRRSSLKANLPLLLRGLAP